MSKKPLLVVVGDGGVGKTSIIVRYTKNQFSDTYEPTLEDSYQANVTMADGSVFQIEIADTAGQEDYKAMRDNYLVKGDAFIIVYSITDSRSLTMAESLLEQISVLREQEPFKFLLCGNKCDLVGQRQVVADEGKALASKYGGEFLETSAFKSINVTESFQVLARLLKEGDKKKTGGGGCCNVA